MDVSTLAFIDSTGYHFADYPTFLAWLQDQYRGIYGADVYLESDSQDGQLLAIFAKALYDTAALGASVYNSFSPVSAQGTGLSRNVKINGVNRRVATHSTADLLIVGQTGTTITNGVAIDSLSQKWNLPASVTIPGGGMITVTATAQDEGAVNAAADTINQIFTPTLGWQTVNNVAGATPGVAAESDAALRIRQAQSTADPSLTVFDGTIGGVANLPGVTAVKGYENDTDMTDANSIPSHSICVVVQGGDDVEIAEEILLHKTPGTGTFGTTSELVYDAHGMPSTINFQRPTPATIHVQITLSAGPGWTTDYEPLIAAAVADIINNGGIGNDVLITKLFAPAYLNGLPAGSTYDIALLELKKNSGSFVTTNIDLDFDEIPVCDPLTDFTFIVS